MSKFLSVLALAGTCLAVSPATGQGLGNSPYSRLGLGDLNSGGNIRNFSMGGTGAASPNSFQINYQNPALVFYNNNVLFELSAVSQVKELKQDSRSQTDGSTGLNNLGLAVPISSRWTVAIGLKPFSRVEYEVNTKQPFENDSAKTALVKFTGEGGISEVYFAHGVKLAKDLVVGGSASYLFGTIDNSQATGIEGDNSFTQVNVRNQTNYNDFIFKAGIAYRYKVGKYQLGAGGVYNFGTSLDARRQTVVQRPVIGGLYNDTVSNFVKGNAQLPGGYQFGLSLDNEANWALALDVSGQSWSNYKSYEGLSGLQNTTQVSLGGEYVPEPASPKYLRRITYRGGFRYGTLPYDFDGKQLNDMALTAGLTLPLGRALITESYFLNMGFAVGRRGTTDSQLVQENYLQFQLGVSLSNKWFIRRQLD